ncbi:hypothetical protein PILCRDRAFT_201213 [Piloderma croceum F 1598]|uniref:Uncharacterized protein n=1 Tax=Piloderma croceum (strain F 1598) TaxID=765440 RepID=A0A0C3BTN7_PILCF|nr:hypothetical protein PILCRDRAFT_201213 [Piloderma croceum F 1598]
MRVLRKTRRDWLGTPLPLIFVNLSPCDREIHTDAFSRLTTKDDRMPFGDYSRILNGSNGPPDYCIHGDP